LDVRQELVVPENSRATLIFPVTGTFFMAEKTFRQRMIK
jgi:hypothetical protein